MHKESTLNSSILPNRNSWIAIGLITLLFSILISYTLPKQSNNPILLTLFSIFLPFLVLCLFNIEYFLLIMLISTFSRLGILGNYISVSLSFVYFFVYLFTRKTLLKTEHDYSSKIEIALIVWILSFTPSLLHVADFANWIKPFLNLIALIIATFVTYKSYRGNRTFILFISSFLILTFVNGLTIFYQFFQSTNTAERVFGFMGIYYIDFVNVAVVSSIALLILGPKTYRVPLILLTLFYLTSLIFTQSRNSFLSLFMTLSILFLILMKYNFKFSFSRKEIIVKSIIALLTVIIILVLTTIAVPELATRFTELFESKGPEIGKEEELVSNSLVSRMLIWHTALNAFLQHPFFGIGLYNFPFISFEYATIPIFLYKQFVIYLTPHQTFIAILAETGIVGMFGFCTLLVTLLRLSFKCFRLSTTITNMRISLILLLSQIYVICSMFFTDAWLWGQSGMLWALLIGITLGHLKKLDMAK